MNTQKQFPPSSARRIWRVADLPQDRSKAEYIVRNDDAETLVSRPEMDHNSNDARNLLTQRPDRECRHANATCHPSGAKTDSKRRHETADGYAAVIARLNPMWRVVMCRDGLQWILQRRKNGGAERPWRGVLYCRTREALIRVSATLCGRIDPSALAILASLPETIGKGGVA